MPNEQGKHLLCSGPRQKPICWSQYIYRHVCKLPTLFFGGEAKQNNLAKETTTKKGGVCLREALGSLRFPYLWATLLLSEDEDPPMANPPWWRGALKCPRDRRRGGRRGNTEDHFVSRFARALTFACAEKEQRYILLLISVAILQQDGACGEKKERNRDLHARSRGVSDPSGPSLTRVASPRLLCPRTWEERRNGSRRVNQFSRRLDLLENSSGGADSIIHDVASPRARVCLQDISSS